MLNLHTDVIGDTAIIHCEGRIVRSEAAFRLRDEVRSQTGAGTIILDLSDVPTIQAGGLGMIVYLQRWAMDHDISFKLVNPKQAVVNDLKHMSPKRDFDTATIDDLITRSPADHLSWTHSH